MIMIQPFLKNGIFIYNSSHALMFQELIKMEQHNVVRDMNMELIRNKQLKRDHRYFSRNVHTVEVKLISI